MGRSGAGARFIATLGKIGFRIVETTPAWKMYDFWAPDVVLGISGDGRWLVMAHNLDNTCEIWRYETNGFSRQLFHQALDKVTQPPLFHRTAAESRL